MNYSNYVEIILYRVCCRLCALHFVVPHSTAAQLRSQLRLIIANKMTVMNNNRKPRLVGYLFLCASCRPQINGREWLFGKEFTVYAMNCKLINYKPLKLKYCGFG